MLLAHVASEPGPYSTSRTPYCREIQDSLALSWVHQVTFLKSTQVGGTQVGLNVLGYAIDQDPGPIIWVMPTREDAAEFGENKVRPMLEASKPLRRQMTGERWDAKRRQIRLSRCLLLFRSARVPKDLAGNSARWLFGDEAGKWTDKAGDEAAPFELARERTRTFWNHKIYLSSTPKHPGLIDREFARGDRRRYHVPCPRCGKFQVLKWSQVKWDKSAHDTEAKMTQAKAAWYECEHCQHRIVDTHKQEMLARGWWCPEDIDPTPHIRGSTLELPDDRATHRSYHIWAGYSPWLSWWQIVAEFLRGNAQNFTNSWLGESWVHRVENTRPEQLRDCVGGYHRGEIPDEVQVLTGGVDVQKQFLVYTVRGWGEDMESWLIDHGRVDSFEQLAITLFTKSWPRKLFLHSVMMDTNYRTGECIDFAKQNSRVVKLCRGIEIDDPVMMRAQALLKHPRTGAPLGEMKAWQVNVGIVKDMVAESMRRRGEAGAGSFHLYEEVDDQYLEEMTAEHKIVVGDGDKARERWVKKSHGRNNHFWDTEVYNRAVAHLIGVANLRSGKAPLNLSPGPAHPPSRPQRPPQQRRGPNYPSFGRRP